MTTGFTNAIGKALGLVNGSREGSIHNRSVHNRSRDASLHRSYEGSGHSIRSRRGEDPVVLEMLESLVPAEDIVESRGSEEKDGEMSQDVIRVVHPRGLLASNKSRSSIFPAEIQHETQRGDRGNSHPYSKQSSSEIELARTHDGERDLSESTQRRMSLAQAGLQCEAPSIQTTGQAASGRMKSEARRNQDLRQQDSLLASCQNTNILEWLKAYFLRYLLQLALA